MLTVCPGGSAKGRWHARVRVPLQQSQALPWLLEKSDRPLLPLTGSVQPLSSESLRASSSTGTDPHHLLYWVVQGPQLGRLFHTQKGNSGETLVNFTQAEVRTQLHSHSSGGPLYHRLTCGHGYQLQHHLHTSLGLLWSRSCMPCPPEATRPKRTRLTVP